MDLRCIPAIEIGGTHVAAAAVDLSSRSPAVRGRRELPLNSQGRRDEIVKTIVDAARLAVDDGLPWGVAIPGPFDYEAGIGRFAGVAKLEALRDVNLGSVLLDRLRPHPAAIVFLNDADAFGLGQWELRTAAGHHRVVAITLGTGIGSAFLADGAVVADDQRTPPEGRVDLLTIGGRPLEETVSRRALVAEYASRAGGVSIDVREIAARARRGDRLARAVFDESFELLGRALGPWLIRFEATALVVGGSIAYSWDLVEPALRRGLDRSRGSVAPVQLLPARLPADAALVGAARHVATLTTGGWKGDSAPNRA